MPFSEDGNVPPESAVTGEDIEDVVQNSGELPQSIIDAIADIQEPELRDQITSYANDAIAYGLACQKNPDMDQSAKNEFLRRMTEDIDGMTGHIRSEPRVRNALVAIWEERDAIAKG